MKRHLICLSQLGVLAVTAGITTAHAAPALKTDVWAALKEIHFGDRSIQDGRGVIGLEAPTRAEDAAIVPITIKDLLPVQGRRRIDKIWLVIDKNPVPMSALFDFTALAGRADIATRVRVNAYTSMRAIAQTNDGRLYMATEFVKASGGCSAPASKDPEAALANLGEIRLRTYDEAASLGEPREVQLMLRHPNHTGLQMNQLTRLVIPAHFVRKISVNYAGEPVLEVETTFSLSENPSLRFSFEPPRPGKLSVQIIDSEDMRFSDSIWVEPAAAQVVAQ